MVQCTIKLNDGCGSVHQGGQLLKGIIEIQLNEPRQFRGLSYAIYGEAYSHWTKTKVEDDEDQRIVEFSGRDIFISSPKNYLLGSDGGNLINLDAGTHSYDFSFQLPQTLPASFEGFFGHIRYKVEVFLDAPWQGKKEFQLQFTIAPNVNLNDLPEVKIPSKSEEIENFCCCCILFYDPLTITVALPYAGFVPGQNIPITIDVDNKSGIETLWTKINLNRNVRFTCNSPRLKTKTETDKIVEVLIEGSPGSCTKRIEKNLSLPQVLMSSTLELCKTINISYELKFEFETRGFHMNSYINVPITIGTIPLDIEATPFSFTEASAPDLDLPPSFDEALKTSNFVSGIGWNVPTDNN